MRRLWPTALLVFLGFSWPGQLERVVADLTSAATPRDKRDALRMLIAMGQPVPWSVVAPFVHDADAAVRADALRLAADPAILAEALQDPAPEVRAVALARVDAEAALAGLNDPEPQLRIAALRNVEALRPLLAALDDDAIEVRIEAVRLLGAHPEARQALLALRDAPLPELRAVALDSLRDVDRSWALDDRDPGVVLAALRSYARDWRDLPVERVRALARSRAYPQVAEAAARLIATPTAMPTRDAPWLPALMRTAYDPSADVLDELEHTLAPGDTLAIEPLEAWLARAPRADVPRIRALIERVRRPTPRVAGDDKRAPR